MWKGVEAINQLRSVRKNHWATDKLRIRTSASGGLHLKTEKSTLWYVVLLFLQNITRWTTSRILVTINLYLPVFWNIRHFRFSHIVSEKVTASSNAARSSSVHCSQRVCFKKGALSLNSGHQSLLGRCYKTCWYCFMCYRHRTDSGIWRL
jgi:hypothetical protein